jgi:hypothetical protein
MDQPALTHGSDRCMTERLQVREIDDDEAGA